MEEKGSYLKFLNLLINSSIFLLDKSFKKIPELKAEIDNSVKRTKNHLRRGRSECIIFISKNMCVS
jgi:ubiquitin conjugation factor E4 B